MMMMMMIMMMMNCFCGMVDRWKAFSLISSRGYCQRSPSSLISDTPRAGFETAQSLSSGFVEWRCTVVITTIPRRHITTTPRHIITTLFPIGEEHPPHLMLLLLPVFDISIIIIYFHKSKVDSYIKFFLKITCVLKATKFMGL